MARRALAGKVAGGIWLQYHDGAPGSNGTANVISDITRTQVAQSAFTIA